MSSDVLLTLLVFFLFVQTQTVEQSQMIITVLIIAPTELYIGVSSYKNFVLKWYSRFPYVSTHIFPHIIEYNPNFL